MLPLVKVVVEGDLDALVAEYLLNKAGLAIGDTYVRNGKAQLDIRINGYNNAARHSPWLVLRDLDKDAECAPALIKALVPEPAPWLMLRVPVRTIETWLIADAVGISNFLGISHTVVPSAPENLDDPKVELIGLARRSNRRIASGLIPTDRSGRSVGIEYNAVMEEFIRAHWSIDRAIANGRSVSLSKTLSCLKNLKETWPRISGTA